MELFIDNRVIKDDNIVIKDDNRVIKEIKCKYCISVIYIMVMLCY